MFGSASGNSSSDSSSEPDEYGSIELALDSDSALSEAPIIARYAHSLWRGGSTSVLAFSFESVVDFSGHMFSIRVFRGTSDGGRDR